MTVRDLNLIIAFYPHIEDLQIALPMFPYSELRRLVSRLTLEASEFLELLATIPTLKRLHLEADQSLGTPDAKNSESTGSDYDDAEKNMRAPHDTKAGTPFEELKITLTSSYRPRNWRLFAGKEEREYSLMWSATRVFGSEIDDAGVYYQYVLLSISKIGRVPNEAEAVVESEAQVDDDRRYNSWRASNDERWSRPKLVPRQRAYIAG
jgi:hypothetical protein